MIQQQPFNAFQSTHTIHNQQPNTIPSSFSINPQYFNLRLIRIKSKIDQLMKDCCSELSTNRGTNQVKTEIINEDRGGQFTSRSQADSYSSRQKNVILAQNVTKQLRQRIKNIYNQIHSLDVVVVRDENSIDTHTFQLRHFLKDLRNQAKRLIRIIPETLLFELEDKKKQSYKKSQIMVKDPNQLIQKNGQNPEEAATSQKKDMQKANQLIHQTFKKRKIFKEEQRYYEDKSDNTKCSLLKCQLI